MLIPFRILLLTLCTLVLGVSYAQAQPDTHPDALSTCDTHALQEELQDKKIALAAIASDLNSLQNGSVASGFSLAAIFTVNLLDNTETAERIEWLSHRKPPATTIPAQCQSDELLAVAKDIQQAQQHITHIRLGYLKLPLAVRQYLVALDQLHQRVDARLSLLTNDLDQSHVRQNAREDALSALTEQYQAIRDTGQRAGLTRQIEAQGRELEALSAEIIRLTARQKTEQTLAALINRLLLDFHRVYMTQPSSAPQTHRWLDNEAESLRPLAKSLRTWQASETVDDEARIDYAKLVLLGNRIYASHRDQMPWWEAARLSGERLTAILKFELRAIYEVPMANLNLKLADRSARTGILAQSLGQSLWIGFLQLLGIFVIWKVVARLPLSVTNFQNHLIKNRLDAPYTRYVIGVLRMLQPNIAWLSAVLIYLVLEHQSRDGLQPWLLLHGGVAIMAVYLLIKMLTFWPIGNTHSHTQVFVSPALQQQIDQDCQRFAMLVTTLFVLHVLLRGILGGGLIYHLYNLFLLVVVWILNYRLIVRYQANIEKHLAMRLSEVRLKQIQTLQRPVLKWLVNPLIFAWLQLTDVIRALHAKLMYIEQYQMLAAKFLRIRLEQGQDSEDEGGEQKYDSSYEQWFTEPVESSSATSQTLTSPWLEKLNELVDNWAESRQEENDVVIMGVSGIGKSTLVRQWQAQWQKTPVALVDIAERDTDPEHLLPRITEALSLPSCETMADLMKAQESLPPTVVIIDNAHNLFVSDVGGFEAYKMLHRLLNTKLDNLCWLVVLNHQPWTYLNDVFGRVYRFSNRLVLQKWSQQDIRKLVLARHEASGRQLHYDELLLASTANSQMAVRAAESRCFNLLWEQSAGIPAIALAIWANNASSPRPGVIEMGIPERPANSELAKLSDDFLFVYASLVIHVAMSSKQIQAATHLPEAVVRRALKLGLDQGFLKRKSHGSQPGQYSIEPLWFLQLSQLLRRKNFLHE